MSTTPTYAPPAVEQPRSSVWYVCPVCRVRCNQPILCPSCDARLVKEEGILDRPAQLPMWDIPAPPKPSQWRIEWRHLVKAGVWAPDPNPWKSYAEHLRSEGDAKNYLRRLRARNKCLRDREFRISVSVWKHNGDISLAWKSTPVAFSQEQLLNPWSFTVDMSEVPPFLVPVF